MNEDPLTISATQFRVHVLLESALCQSSSHQQGCKCAMMQRQYGLRLFKCNRLGCPFFRTGFDAMPERDRHLRTHDRPYKCDRPNCDFSQMGFGSQARLNVHLQHHEKQGTSLMAHRAEVDSNEDVELILLDAVKADDLDLVRDFIADVPQFHEKLLQQAVKSSSCAMVKVLLNACNSVENIESTVLTYAVTADNLEASRMFLDHGAYVDSELDLYQCMNLAMNNTSPEMIKLLLQYLPVEEIRQRPYTLCQLITPRTGAFHEAKIIQCLSLLRNWTHEPNASELCFKLNGDRCYSIIIAEYLLRNGVDINFCGNDGQTALWLASKKGSRRAAELMKFLLESGADINVKVSSRCQSVADGAGPRKISKWFGVSWEQLVEESHEKYAASLKPEPE